MLRKVYLSLLKVTVLFTCLVAQETPLMLQNFAPLDGCRYVFLDVGSNIGIHARFLFEPELYPKQKYTKTFFDAYFPLTDRIKRKDICVVGFEPNPKHRKRLQRLQSYYQSLGLRVHWFAAGVGDQNGKRTFVLDNRDESNSKNNDWGFRSIVSKRERRERLDTKTVKTEELEIIRFADFIQSKVLNRKIPALIEPTDPPPAVVAKMDIEHEEYSVLKDLLDDDSRLFCALSAISIEFHYYHPQMKKVLNVPSGAAQVHFKNLVEVKEMMNAARARPNCHTKVIQFDSEDYLNDTETGVKVLEKYKGIGS